MHPKVNFTNHSFPCAFVCAPLIPMCIYVWTIYSHVHLCVHHFFPCAFMCAPFIPMYIYVCTIYSHVHLCVHHLFQCTSMCAPFIPMCIYVCIIYSHVHHLFPSYTLIHTVARHTGQLCMIRGMDMPM